jgi:NAD(P)-dependent dehydrogenase (short-subunit alcohol dehydrogenase family)
VTSRMVVTGAAGDLGRAIATHFARNGWRVDLLDVDDVRLRGVADEVGGRAITCDVRERDDLERAFAVVGADGKIDCLVNAAGLTRPAPSFELSTVDWDAVIGVNLTGTFRTCQAAFPLLRRGSAIVNVSSISGTRARPGRAAYTASKAGVDGLTASLAVEWAPSGIRVNAVAPAWIDNAFLRDLASRGIVDPAELVTKIPLGRLCTDEDVVQAVRFLADPAAAAFITGQVLYVDGGYVVAG